MDKAVSWALFVFMLCGSAAMVFFCVLMVGMLIDMSESRVPAEPVPCKCAKCDAKCCEVGK